MCSDQGWIQDFSFGGGGGAQKIMGVHTHRELEAQSPLRPGSRAHLSALEALGGGGGGDWCSLVLSEPPF